MLWLNNKKKLEANSQYLFVSYNFYPMHALQVGLSNHWFQTCPQFLKQRYFVERHGISISKSSDFGNVKLD